MPSLYDELLIALHGVWNRRWLALSVAWGVCVAGWLAVSLIPNAYESKARVYVATQSIIQDKVGISALEQQKNLDAIRQTLSSSVNLEKVVRGTDLAGTVANDADIMARAGSLKDKIAIVSTEDNLFEITTTMSDRGNSDRANARLATQITQKLLDIFQEENISGNRDETKQGLAFLDQQISQTGKALAEADKKRVEFNQQFAGILPGAGSITDRMAAAQTELNQIESQLMGAQSALAAMNGQLAGTPATIAGGGGGGTPTALTQAMNDLASAKARGWTDNHPDVIAMKRQIAAIRAAGGSATTGGGSAPNPAYLSIRSMQAERAAAVQALTARKSQIEGDLAAIAARQIADPGLASEGERLDRDYDVLKAQYDKLLSDRGEVRLRGDVQSGTKGAAFRIIDPPSVPTAPASPNRPLLLIGVLIAGIGAGVGAAFIFGQVQPTFPTAARLAKAAGLPVLGTVTETLSELQLEERKHKLKLFAGASGALGAACLLLIVVEFIQRGMA